MASPTGVSSHSSTPHRSGSEEDLQRLMEQRMKKRKLSNRESARRSRIRKQNHIEELLDQVVQLQKEQQQLEANLNLTRHLCINVEVEASVIQAQIIELSYRLAWLNEISSYAYTTSSMNSVFQADDQQTSMDPWNHPISASADIFMH